MRNILLIFLLFQLSCSYFEKKSEHALARVDKEYLYLSELKGIVPPGASVSDSLNLTRSYIDNWIRGKVLLHHAEKNLTETQKDFTRELKEYQHSLIVYTYENALIRQQLDTIVSDNEIEEYYQNNQQNFLLKDNIVMVTYVKVPLDSPHLRQIRRYFFSGDPDAKDKFADLCDKYATDYYINDGTWLLFNDVLEEIPINTYNQEEFLRNRRTFEMQDSLFIYLVRFIDFKIKENISPLQFEQERIRSIILNKRKIDLLNAMRQDVYEKALRQNTVELYK